MPTLFLIDMSKALIHGLNWLWPSEHNIMNPTSFRYTSYIMVNFVIGLLSQATIDPITAELIDLLLVFIPIHLTEALDTTAPFWHLFVPWLP